MPNLFSKHLIERGENANFFILLLFLHIGMIAHIADLNCGWQLSQPEIMPQ
jgi:hypothetical protein